MEKTIKRDTEKAALVAKVARICRVTKRQVYRVISGDQDNEQIINAYMTLLEGECALVEAVRKAVPF